MTLTIELTPEQEAQLTKAARKEGMEPTAFAQKIVTDYLPILPPDVEQDPTLALFEQWRQEDALKTPEEGEQERRLWEAFEQGINGVRKAQEMRQL